MKYCNSFCHTCFHFHLMLKYAQTINQHTITIRLYMWHLTQMLQICGVTVIQVTQSAHYPSDNPQREQSWDTKLQYWVRSAAAAPSATTPSFIHTEMTFITMKLVSSNLWKTDVVLLPASVVSSYFLFPFLINVCSFYFDSNPGVALLLCWPQESNDMMVNVIVFFFVLIRQAVSPFSRCLMRRYPNTHTRWPSPL